MEALTTNLGTATDTFFTWKEFDDDAVREEVRRDATGTDAINDRDAILKPCVCELAAAALKKDGGEGGKML